LDGLEPEYLAIEVEKRLDELLGEDTPGASEGGETVNLQALPLAELKDIVLSLEWEVTDDLLDEFLNEVKKLCVIFASDQHVPLLLRILGILGRYIKTYQGDTHPHVFKTLFGTHASLEKLFSAPRTPAARQQIIKQEVMRYHSLRNFLKSRQYDTKPKQTPRYFRKSSKRNDLKRSARTAKIQAAANPDMQYFADIKRNLIELKQFISYELHRLRGDIMELKKSANRSCRLHRPQHSSLKPR